MHQLLAGARNGSVKLFDLRLSNEHQQTSDLLKARFTRAHSIVCNMEIIDDWQILVSGTNHKLELFDLRFIRHGDPIITFLEYRNAYRDNLPLVHDSLTNTIIAFTEDFKLKLWSSATGRILNPTNLGPQSLVKTFDQKFAQPIKAMEVVNTPSQNTLYLAVNNHIQEHSLFH